jgi:peptidoglycan hydrolase-like protein with peptidoglycan-binding domain
MRRLLCVLCGFVLLVTTSRADDLVATVQKKLLRAGYYHGTVDGDMGSQTAAAVRRYQLAEKLTVTGQLTPETLQKLGLSR